MCPAYALNLSSGHALVIHKYMINGSHDKALAFNWLRDYLHQQFTIAKTHLKHVGFLLWLHDFQFLKGRNTAIEWSSTWPRNHCLRENTAKNFCLWLTFENYWDFFELYQNTEFISLFTKKKNHFFVICPGHALCWKSQQSELICYL